MTADAGMERLGSIPPESTRDLDATARRRVVLADGGHREGTEMSDVSPVVLRPYRPLPSAVGSSCSSPE